MRTLSLALIIGMIGFPVYADGYQRLEGHGGPIRGIAVSPDGKTALTASFDNSVGFWDINGDEPADPRWLEGHEAASNAVAYLPHNAQALSGGDDFALMLWSLTDGTALARMEGHQGKILDISVTPDADLAATAGWDGFVGVWDMTTATLKGFLKGHRGPVQAVHFAEDGAVLYSGSSDGTVRRWNVPEMAFDRIEASHGFGVNRLVIDEAAGWLAYGALDGGVRIVDLENGEEIADVTSGRQPVLGLTLSRDKHRLGIADGEGFIHVVATKDWSTIKDFRAVPRGPVWALAFDHSGTHVLAGTIQDHVDIWPIDSTVSMAESDVPIRDFHRAPESMSNGERQFARKCSICHTLGADNRRRAGPSLYAIFGRKAGTLPGYSYSKALDGADLVWNEVSLDKLFDIGPDHYTPGSKMPMQRIVRDEDRADLIAFLKMATDPTAPKGDTDQ